MAIAAEITPPMRGSRPSMASSAEPGAGDVADVEDQPADHDETASRTHPAPGSTLLPSSCARRPDDADHPPDVELDRDVHQDRDHDREANAAPSATVKVAVWVMKPGPMARSPSGTSPPAQRGDLDERVGDSWSDAEIAIVRR